MHSVFAGKSLLIMPKRFVISPPSRVMSNGIRLWRSSGRKGGRNKHKLAVTAVPVNLLPVPDLV